MGKTPEPELPINKIPVLWDQVISMCRRLASQIHGKTFRSILAIARGGLVPARLLSTFLGDVPVWAITCQRYDGTKPGCIKICNTNVLKDLIQPVLVVDEICDAGETMLQVTQLLQRNKIIFEVAVLVQKARTRGLVKVNYCADLVETDTSQPQPWYCFPWEKEFFDLESEKKS